MVALSNLEASSSLPPSSSSATPNGEYHVFISFRGKDTRNSFVSHLYQALFQRGIKTFKDDEELKKGEHIKELLTAIEKSRFSIVVFSEDFASSRWCLDEVEKIVDCVSSREQTVLPVFYHINPTDVRHQKGSFKDAFAKHEERNKEDSGKVQRWRSALTEVADRSGYTSWDGPESVVIQKIVEQISTKLNLTFLHIDERLVGINNRVEKILLLLDMESKHDVRYIGIHGMGGMGKTAAAKVVYNQIFRQFEGSSYLANIREHSKQHGLPSLQKQLLSEILGKGNLDIPNVDKGNPIIKQRLPYKRVLIILDDVDQSNQIEALAGKCDWFGSGSRIIITTRDARLLDLPEVNERHQVERYQVERYQVEQLSDNESLELFCEKAFKNDRPLKDFEDLSNEVVKYANGLPFALKFLGSYLFRRSISEWKSALKETPHIHIINMLIVSFDGLEELHKKIFLDVACFFKGQTKNEVMESLNSFGRDPQIGISTLVERSLISFFTVEVEWECEGEVLLPRVWMHNLVQEMGWHIVRQESQHEPGGRSRLWRLEDIFHVLANNTGTEAIETIMLPGNYIGSRHEGDIIPEVFLKMPRLRFLYLADILFSQGVTVLPNELRVLEWWEFPSESLPPNFHPHELVKLSLHGNCIKQLWKGAKAFQKLLYLDLSCCYDLTEVPDLSGSPNLEFLNLLGCTKLLEVHPSVSELKKLKRLNLYGCGNLITPACSIDLPSLQYFNLSGCSKLKKFPEIQGIMKCLKQLYLGRTPIIELPSSIRNLTALSYLDLAKCKNLLSLPGSICELTSLQELFLDSCSMLKDLPGNIGNLQSLTKLNLSNCNKLSSLPGSICELTSLKELFLDSCSMLKDLPGNIGNLKSLTKLNLSNCNKLSSLPGNIFEMTSLQELFLDNCSTLEYLPGKIGNLKSLTKLGLSNCSMLKDLPGNIGNLKSLTKLNLSNCNRLSSLPGNIFEMTSLQELFLDNCSTLEYLPGNIGNLKSLTKLGLSNCSMLKDLPGNIGNLQSLTKLNLSNCNKLSSLPGNIFEMTSLQELFLDNCSTLEYLPGNIGNLKSLTKLGLSNCSMLKDLPGNIGNLQSLTKLNLSNCNKLSSLPGNMFEMTSLQELFLDSCSMLKDLPGNIGNLKSLTKLNLSNCSMLECLPGNMGNLKSLTKLNLSNCNKLSSLPGNIFEMTSLQELFLDNCSTLEYLPGNIGNLKSLTKLGLSNCKNLLSLPSSISELTSLQALPELPSDTKEIEASGCTSLKRLWKNNIPVEFKGGILLDSNNCFQMGMNEQSVIDVLQRIQFQAVDSFDICLPGNDIPEWFSHQRQSIGSSLSVPLPSNWHTSNLIMGFLYCALGGEFFPQKKICLVAEITVDDNIIIASSKDSVGDSRVGYWKKDKGKCHMWLGYRSLNFLECSNDHVPGREGINTELKISLSSTSTKWVDITRCGVHLVYKLQG